MSAIIDGQEHYVTNGKNQFLRAANVIDLQKLLKDVTAKESVLRHTSAYDEMVGGPEKIFSNLLEVPLADNKLY